MRRGSQETQILTSPIIETEAGKSGGQIIGVSLGWDFVAEHEWGISGICNAFGILGKPQRGHVGADIRTITKVPAELKFFPNLKGSAYLIYCDSFSWRQEKPTSQGLNEMLHVHEDWHGSKRKGEDLSTAWSERAFGIRMRNDALNIGTMTLGQIYEAFTKLDIMIFLGGKSIMGNSGLVIAIRSRMPKDALQNMKTRDESYLDLMDAVENTGIKSKLEAAKKEYFALSPRWARDHKEIISAYPVIFWLNPYDQQNNNYGLFTVEQLLEWIEGKGPIPKS